MGIVSLDTVNQKILKQFYEFHKARYREDRDEALARLVAYNIGDGTICNRYQVYKKDNREISKYNHNQASFYSKYKDDLELIANDLVVSGICEHKPNVIIKKSHKEYDDTYQLTISWARANVLIEYGCPVGEKVKQKFLVPEWIYNGNANIKAEFLAALWGAEGFKPTQSRYKKEKNCKTIVMVMCKRKHEDGIDFHNQIITMLSSLGINSSLTVARRGKNYCFQTYISSNKENVKKFFDVVGYRYCIKKEFGAFLWSNYYEAYLKSAEIRGTVEAGWKFPYFDDWVNNYWGTKEIFIPNTYIKVPVSERKKRIEFQYQDGNNIVTATVEEDLIGKKFNKLTVIGYAYKQRGRHFWNCLCDCGNVKAICQDEFKRGKTKSCGCHKHTWKKLIDISGQKFGRLTAIRFLRKNKSQYYWECKCDCGNVVEIDSGRLRSGATKSCGCLRSDVSKENVKKAQSSRWLN